MLRVLNNKRDRDITALAADTTHVSTLKKLKTKLEASAQNDVRSAFSIDANIID